MSEAAKSDEHLYRELKWLVPTTCLSTYVTSGKWQRDLLEVDLALIKAHRREAGAPEPKEVDLTQALPELQGRTIRAHNAEDQVVTKEVKTLPAPAKPVNGKEPKRHHSHLTDVKNALQKSAPKAVAKEGSVKTSYRSAYPDKGSNKPVGARTGTTVRTEETASSRSNAAAKDGRSAYPDKGPTKPVGAKVATTVVRTIGAPRPSEAEIPKEPPSAAIVMNFINKFSLHETQTKLLMTKLPPAKRWEVIRSFKPPNESIPVMTALRSAVHNLTQKSTSKAPGRLAVSNLSHFARSSMSARSGPNSRPPGRENSQPVGSTVKRVFPNDSGPAAKRARLDKPTGSTSAAASTRRPETGGPSSPRGRPSSPAATTSTRPLPRYPPLPRQRSRPVPPKGPPPQQSRPREDTRTVGTMKRVFPSDNGPSAKRAKLDRPTGSTSAAASTRRPEAGGPSSPRGRSSGATPAVASRRPETSGPSSPRGRPSSPAATAQTRPLPKGPPPRQNSRPWTGYSARQDSTPPARRPREDAKPVGSSLKSSSATPAVASRRPETSGPSSPRGRPSSPAATAQTRPLPKGPPPRQNSRPLPPGPPPGHSDRSLGSYGSKGITTSTRPVPGASQGNRSTSSAATSRPPKAGSAARAASTPSSASRANSSAATTRPVAKHGSAARAVRSAAPAASRPESKESRPSRPVPKAGSEARAAGSSPAGANRPSNATAATAIREGLMSRQRARPSEGKADEKPGELIRNLL